MEFGFEIEFFLKDRRGEWALAPSWLPHDDCGYLAEARSTPASDPTDAAYLAFAAVHRLKECAKRARLTLVAADTVQLPPEFTRAALRQHGKPATPHDRGSMYGYDYDADDTRSRAGLHIHFTNNQTRHVGTSSLTVSAPLDMPKIIRRLDVAFEREIEQAGRVRGLYEMKAHGGFEYRSLPATLDVRRLVPVLQELRGC